MAAHGGPHYSSLDPLLSPSSLQISRRGSSDKDQDVPSHLVIGKRCPSKRSFLLSLKQYRERTQLLKSKLNNPSLP